MDLFSNPMVESAKNALTDEQKQDYKKIGEYMYNNQNYNIVEQGSQIKDAQVEDILVYAITALRSGGDPHDLSQKELQELENYYGEKWYEQFNLEESEVPKLNISIKPCRQEKRALERKIKKNKK